MTWEGINDEEKGDTGEVLVAIAVAVLVGDTCLSMDVGGF